MFRYLRVNVLGFAGGGGPQEHHAPVQVTGLKSRPFEHPRQPNEPWCSIRLGTFRWIEGSFFNAPVPSG